MARRIEWIIVCIYCEKELVKNHYHYWGADTSDSYRDALAGGEQP